MVDHIKGSCGIAPVKGFRSVTDYECEGKYTLAHEIGHNLGAGHHRKSGDTSTQRCSYGIRFPGKARSLMAYECDGRKCPRQPFFSDTSVRYAGEVMGRACGGADGAQNVNVVRSMIPQAARYR
jgi:hypothetical protein